VVVVKNTRFLVVVWFGSLGLGERKIISSVHCSAEELPKLWASHVYTALNQHGQAQAKVESIELMLVLVESSLVQWSRRDALTPLAA
jgi:hypothetical protein